MVHEQRSRITFRLFDGDLKSTDPSVAAGIREMFSTSVIGAACIALVLTSCVIFEASVTIICKPIVAF